MGTYQGSCPLYRNSRRHKAATPKAPPGKRKRQKFRRVEGAIRSTADTFVTWINAEIGVALQAKRTGPETKRLRAVQRACGKLQQKTLELLFVLHGLEEPAKKPATKQPPTPRKVPEST